MAETKDISNAEKRLDQAHEFLHIDQKKKDLKALEETIAAPGFWDDAQHAQKISKQASDIRELLENFQKAKSYIDDAQTALELADDDADMAQEADTALKHFSSLMTDFEIESWFPGRFDKGNAIVTVNPGSGGLEAQDWADMLYHMYVKYAERRGWKVHLLDIQPAEVIGIERASIQIDGKFAYGMLRSEIGVHRLVRISPTDEKKRRHTTFASVEVMPVLPDDIEVDLNPSDVRVDVYRASGPGGQCVNTTDSAVRLTHIPTGIVVTCQNQKSQLQNKEAAFRVLRAKLYEHEEKKRQEEISKLQGDKMESSFGSQIRNYVLYPYRMVKDVRTGIETGNVDAVLDGDLDAFVLGFHRWQAAGKPSARNENAS